MSDKSFEITILPGHCKGCGYCVAFCAQDKFFIDPKPDKKGIQHAVVRPEVDCTGCMQCVTMCPDAAIQITRRQAPVASRTGSADEPEK